MKKKKKSLELTAASANEFPLKKAVELIVRELEPKHKYIHTWETQLLYICTKLESPNGALWNKSSKDFCLGPSIVGAILFPAGWHEHVREIHGEPVTLCIDNL